MHLRYDQGVPPSEMPIGVMPKEFMRMESLPIFPHAPTDPKSQHTKFDAKKAVSRQRDRAGYRRARALNAERDHLRCSAGKGRLAALPKLGESGKGTR